MKNKIIITYILLIAVVTLGYSQGPPITGDKPIMLSGGTMLVKTLTEIRHTDQGKFTRAPIMVHYIFSNKFLMAAHIPHVSYQFDNSEFGEGSGLGDIQLMAKYQIFRSDNTGKTLRVVAKTVQNFPTGEELGIEGMSTGEYESYQGFVLGYETIKYGLGTELGYNVAPSSLRGNELIHKFGVGLPLLKPVYPVNQINLYFEYQQSWFPQTEEYQLFYAQGVQYAIDQLTFEAAVQIPLVQDVAAINKRKYSILLGTRYVF